MSKMRRRVFAAGSAAFAFSPYIVSAQKKYDTGVTDKEIKLGHTNPYSGPLSAYGTIGKTQAVCSSRGCSTSGKPMSPTSRGRLRPMRSQRRPGRSRR